MLRVNNLCFSYDTDSPLLINVNYEQPPGTIVGVFGASGEGKSTFVRCLAGYLRPQSGSLYWNGHNLWEEKPAYWPIQLIHQHPEQSFDPHWRMRRVLDTVEHAAQRRLQTDPAWGTHFPHELSAGQLQRLAIGRLLRPRTEFIIADEATTMLDALTQASVWNFLVQYARETATPMLVVSHDKSLLHCVSDTVVPFEKIKHS